MAKIPTRSDDELWYAVLPCGCCCGWVKRPDGDLPTSEHQESIVRSVGLTPFMWVKLADVTQIMHPCHTIDGEEIERNIIDGSIATISTRSPHIDWAAPCPGGGLVYSLRREIWIPIEGAELYDRLSRNDRIVRRPPP